MSYQVFARKYRPRTFDDILGQDHVVQTLRNAIAQNRLAHAYLFVGPRGTGKTSTARILAKALNCPGGPRIDFDPEDDVCREIAEGSSLDVLEIDGASNNSVDQIRELRESVMFAPSRGKFRIYYIDEVHMLSPAAFNALLKTLEEPPAHVKFLFATTEPTKILPTIISRCQRFDLRRIPEKTIAAHLLYIAGNEGVTLDLLAAHAIAKGAEGGMRDAQSMLDQLVAFCGNEINEADVLEIFGFTSHQTVASLGESILRADTAHALNRLHEQTELGKDLAKLLGDLIGHCRNLLVFQVDPDSVSADLPDDTLRVLKEQSILVPTEKLLALIDVLADTDGRMKWAPNKKLQFEVGIIRCVQTLSQTSIGDVIELIDRAIDDEGAPPPARQGSAATQSSPRTPRAKEPAASTPAEPSTASAATSAPAAPGTGAPAVVESEGLPAYPRAVDPPRRASVAEPSALSGAGLWRELAIEVDRRRPLATTWLKAAQFESDEGKHFVIAFPPEEDFARESLARPNNKAFLEEILQELSGKKLTLKLKTREDLAPATPRAAEPEPEPVPDFVLQPEAAAPGPKPDDSSSDQGEEPAETALPEERPPAGRKTPKKAAASDRANHDHDEALIKEALEIFEAEIR